MNSENENRGQTTERAESEPKEKDEMERAGESLEAPAASSTAQHSSSRERFMRHWWRGSVIVISLLSLPPTVIPFLSYLTLSFPSSLLIWIILMGA